LAQASATVKAAAARLTGGGGGSRTFEIAAKGLSVRGKEMKWFGLWLLPAALLVAQPALAAKQAPSPAPVQAYQPKPGLWLLADEDTKIYLFGTIHLLAPGFKWRSPALDKAAAEADELVVETHEEPGADRSDVYLRAALLETPKPLLERVPVEHWAKLGLTFERLGIPLENVATMRTWMVAVLLGFAQELERWGVETIEQAPGVEVALEAQFSHAGKPISSVETPEAGLAAFDALSDADEVKLLLNTLAEGNKEQDAAMSSDDLWAQGRYEEAYARDIAELPPVLFDGLVVKRNAAWVNWLKARLDKPGTVLFAVGAAHLAGPQSVQKMLADRGLEAKRVD
jgi:hypothetical protein